MVWKNAELFNVSEIEETAEGGIRVYRFPKAVRDCFERATPYSVVVGQMTTGCEIRFVGDEAEVVLSANENGTVEIFRGNYYHHYERVNKGEKTTVVLKRNTALEKFLSLEHQGSFSPDVWRIVFDHDIAVTVHDIRAIKPIRPPKKEELPQKKILAYGSSITHSAGSALFLNSYLATIGRELGADVLCKGMGGSCYCQKEVGDYIADEERDLTLLELGVNMVGEYTVSEFKTRASYIVKRALESGKPVVVISIFTCFHDLPESGRIEKNGAFIAALEEICREQHCENLYYIKGQEIVTDWKYLTADLIHPSPFGHIEMGKKIAKKIRDLGIL